MRGKLYLFAYYLGKGLNLIPDVFHNDPPILIYQVGKVGSTSVYLSLRERCKNVDLYHAHIISKEGEDFLKEWVGYITPSAVFPEVLQARLIRSRYHRYSGDKRWKVISLIRDPVALNLSSFFQNIRKFFPDFRDEHYMDDSGAEKLLQCFYNEYPHDLPETWFKQEIGGFLGIDIYKKVFDHKQGYILYEGEKADLLILRLEDLDRIGERIIGEFMGIDNFMLKKSNVAKNKYYARSYRNIVSNKLLSEEYVCKTYGSAIAKYFYTPGEIENFKTRWLI